MSAFKQFLSSNVIVAPYNASKDFKLHGATTINNGIDFYVGVNEDFFDLNGQKSGLLYNEYNSLVYKNIKHLYYSNDYKYNIVNVTSSIDATCIDNKRVIYEMQNALSESNNRFYNYPQSDLNYIKYFPTESNSNISVIKIPQNIFGDNIIPNSFKLNFDNQQYYDDGEGNILYNGNIVGNIFYSHGNIVFTSGSINTISNRINYNGEISKLLIEYKSSHTIFENQYKCVILDSEYNYTLNPSTYDCNGNILQNIQQSDNFTPYVTTVGLYNDNKDLLMIAKLSKPIKISETTDTIIQINFDNF